ncbi:hypothetical protein [Planctomycetes bacterium Pan216]
MSYERVKDILRGIRDFRAQVKEYYSEVAYQAENERAHLLIDYVSTLEEDFKNELEQLGEEQAEKILNTWFQYLPQHDARAAFEGKSLDAGLSYDDVVERVASFQEHLVELYRQLAKIAPSPSTKEFFANLYEVGHERLKQESLASLQFKDAQ